MFTPRTWTLVTMVLAAAATRIVPHDWNFTPVGAICLFGGASFTNRWAAVLVPLIALVLSDVYLALAVYGFTGFQVMAMSYVLFGLTAVLGMTLRGRTSFWRVSGTAVLAAALFFVLSNFQAWLTGYEGYPYTLAGLATCFLAALPFAQSMLLGNLFYSAVLFGGWELLQMLVPNLAERRVATAGVIAR